MALPNPKLSVLPANVISSNLEWAKVLCVKLLLFIKHNRIRVKPTEYVEDFSVRKVYQKINGNLVGEYLPLNIWV